MAATLPEYNPHRTLNFELSNFQPTTSITPVVASPGEAEFECSLSESAGQILVADTRQIGICNEAVAAFNTQVEPAENIDFDTCGRLNDHDTVGAKVAHTNLAAAGIDVDHRVYGFEILKAVAQGTYAPAHIEILVLQRAARIVVVGVVFTETDKQRLAKFKAEKAAAQVGIVVAEADKLMFGAAPDAGKAQMALAGHGLFVLGKSGLADQQR